MHNNTKNVLLIAMPYAGTAIPSIQLPILKGYLKERNVHVETRHLYLKAAEFYGLTNYNFLINSPSDSYTAQMGFSKYVFPDHWGKNINKIKEHFNKILDENKDFKTNFSFEDYIQNTDNFLNWTIKNIEWDNFEYIGFTLNYGQFLPSLAVAKQIKEINPNKKIIFGGSRTAGELGKRLLQAFNYIDYIISGDGEEALFVLTSDFEDLGKVPNLTFRKNNEILSNPINSIDINNAPLPDFDQFYYDLNESSEDVKQYFFYYGKLPIEITRGCWWNKCTFCNLNIQNSKYREKNVDRIVEEICFLSNKYKMLNFQFIGNTIHKKEYRSLLEKIKNLDRDLTFVVEVRADQLERDDYSLLKEAGFNVIQTGIESFSKNYLGKMNKGTRVIDNIAALKYCKENGIINRYNLIIKYPNEDENDFRQTKETVKNLMGYIDPPTLNDLLIGYGSPIYRNPSDFNISELDYTEIDKLIFPEELLDKKFNFYYSFKTNDEVCRNDWDQLIKEWKEKNAKIEIHDKKMQTGLDKMDFYFADGGDFIKIVDRRNKKNIRILMLDDIEREIFLKCLDVKTFEEIQVELPNIPEFKLAPILHSFEAIGIVFREGDTYLSLPLQYKKHKSKIEKNVIEARCL